MIAAHLLAVACPTCTAPVGEPCRTHTGKRSDVVHAARQTLAHDHDHDLDGKLHDGDGCRMCTEIRRRYEVAKRDYDLDKLGNHYAAKADRTNR